jgi:hypothetical protein
MDQIVILFTASVAIRGSDPFRIQPIVCKYFLEWAALHKAHADAATAIFSFPPCVEPSSEIDQTLFPCICSKGENGKTGTRIILTLWLSANGDEPLARGRKPIAPQRPAHLK